MYLLADIGGTNARFALGDETGRTHAVRKLRTADFATADAAFTAAIEELHAANLNGAYVAWAGPVINGAAALTNRDGWQLHHDKLADLTGAADVRLVNDFVAQTRAIPMLTGSDIAPLLNGDDDPTAPFVVIGPGTGLGIGMMSARDQSGHVLAGEGGHVTLPARNADEAALIAIIGRTLDHVSAERCLSGGELYRLYEAIALRDGAKVEAGLSGGAIAALAKQGDPTATATIAQFLDFLGTVASDLAVTCGARGGVWLTGDLLKQWRADHLLDDTRLIARFTDKGRFSSYCSECGLYQNLADDPAFIGLMSFIPTTQSSRR